MFCFCPVRHLGLLCLLGMFGCFKRPHIFGGENRPTIRKRLGRSISHTCAKCQGLTLKNGVEIWTLVRLSGKITAWRAELLGLSTCSTPGVKFDIGAVPDFLFTFRSFFCANFCISMFFFHVVENLECKAFQLFCPLLNIHFGDVSCFSCFSCLSWKTKRGKHGEKCCSIRRALDIGPTQSVHRFSELNLYNNAFEHFEAAGPEKWAIFFIIQ